MTQGLNPGRSKRLFTSSKRCDQLWGSSLIFSGHHGSFLGVMQLGCEADCLPPPSVKVKNEWGYTSAPHISLRGVDKDLYLFFHTEY
jgi:hypothetical protein